MACNWVAMAITVVALRAAGDLARGSELFVTLEPCCHHGKTPPCTDAILAAGVLLFYVIEFMPTAREQWIALLERRRTLPEEELLRILRR